jgi:hypothetical protein
MRRFGCPLESASKTTIAYQREIDYMTARWSRNTSDDPHYNPNLTRLGEGYTPPL